MKKKVLLMVAILLVLPAFTCMALDLEARIGTGPSAMVTAAWDISPYLSVAATFGISGFGGAVQTGSITVQTRSYTINMRTIYSFPLGTSSLKPYLAIGANLEFADGTLLPFLETTIGVRTNLTSSIYLLGEVSSCINILDIADSYWRARLGIGFHLRFWSGL